uniref:P-loop containing nucleoside triphosphate hydrolase protein n=1 Tax=Mycena chlorophos TaxID=658473 RepID=A0ABQ0KZ79_MYCCL|nr:P-loop containing nucleoside triphosphate hydrolase protein [Mycena chlorophos]
MDGSRGEATSVRPEAPTGCSSPHASNASSGSVPASEAPALAPSPSPTAPLPPPPPPPRANAWKRVHKWSIREIRELGLKHFGKRPCWAQIKPVLALQAGKDVVNVAPTGFGKTMSFLLRLLMARADGEDKMIIAVTPLITIGKQLEESLEKAGIKCVNLHAENNSPELYKAIAPWRISSRNRESRNHGHGGVP